MFDYDDFYEEPTEFDEQIAEFKAGLMKSVKQEFLDKMDRLEKENASLQDFKKRKEQMEREHQNALIEMRNYIEAETRRVKNAKLRTLLGEHLTVGWGLKSIAARPPKCDKCDDNRRVHFKSPSGNELTEPCECDKAAHTYKPEELSLVKFYMDSEKKTYGEERVERHFTKASRWFDSDYDEYVDSSNIYEEGTPFEEVHHYGIVFLDKDTCQKYCDWLNEKEVNNAERG